jgi:hypothetical protein
MLISPFDDEGGTSLNALKHAALTAQRRYGLWVLYPVFVFASLATPVTVDRGLTLGLTLLLLGAHLRYGLVYTFFALCLGCVRVYAHACMCMYE